MIRYLICQIDVIVDIDDYDWLMLLCAMKIEWLCPLSVWMGREDCVGFVSRVVEYGEVSFWVDVVAWQVMVSWWVSLMLKLSTKFESFEAGV